MSQATYEYLIFAVVLAIFGVAFLMIRVILNYRERERQREITEWESREEWDI